MARILSVCRFGGQVPIYLNLDCVSSVEFCTMHEGRLETWQIRTANPESDCVVSREDAQRILQALGHADPLQTSLNQGNPGVAAVFPLETEPTTSLPGNYSGFRTTPIEPSFADGFVPFRPESPSAPPPNAPAPVRLGAVGGISDHTETMTPKRRDVPDAIKAHYRDARECYSEWITALDADTFFHDEETVTKARDGFYENFSLVVELCSQEDSGVSRAVTDKARADFALISDDEGFEEMLGWLAPEN